VLRSRRSQLEAFIANIHSDNIATGRLLGNLGDVVSTKMSGSR
jgi:hypothetical protein